MSTATTGSPLMRCSALVLLIAMSALSCGRAGEDADSVAQRGVRAAPGETEEAADERTPIQVDAVTRVAVLTEMRTMLRAVQGIAAGAANQDTVAMRQAAMMAGMQAAAEASPAVRQQLGSDFLALGMRTHASFDSLAADVALRDRNVTLRRLATIMGNCVGCHEQWRLAVVPSR